MPVESTIITTADGRCPASVFTPSSGAGPWPAAIIYMDAFSIRPALSAMGQRLADAGFVVLLPDLYYRAGDYEPLDPAAVFASGDVRGAIGPLMASTSKRMAAEDTAAFLDHLEGRADVVDDRIRTVGYCMGGGMSLTVAATYPDRVVAAASFHGGGLATDDEDSPHLLMTDAVTADIYVGAADNDNSYPPEMAGRLCESLMAGGVRHRHELYPGAAHGWTMTDFPVYDDAAAERHWNQLIGLFTHGLG